MFAFIYVDETMDIQCLGVTSSEPKANKMLDDYLKELKNRHSGNSYSFNSWVSTDGRDKCVEISYNGRFWALVKLCKRTG